MDSFQWIKNKTTFPEWFNEALVNKTVEITTYAMVIHTLDGDVVINDGDWVFNIKGKLYSCKESVYPNVRETLGATGEFPEGKLNEDDEGELIAFDDPSVDGDLSDEGFERLRDDEDY